MKKMILLSAVAALVGCQAKNNVADNTPRSLILYYSQCGTTEKVAQVFDSLLLADMTRFDVTEPYNDSYEATIERCKQERENGLTPKLATLSADLAAYDTIYLGFPIWFGTYAPPVAALIAEQNLAGKVIVPFCTYGSGGRYSALADLQKALPESTTILQPYGIRAARVDKASAEVTRFLAESGIVKGVELDTLPEYGEMQPVAPDDIEVFNAACGDYPMPLGSPVNVAKRTTNSSYDYKFEVLSGERQATIYVTRSLDEDSQPEFTEVVR